MAWTSTHLRRWYSVCLLSDCRVTTMFSDLTTQKEGTLLGQPSAECPVFDRIQPTYSGYSERFKLGERSFSRQYAHIYAARLMQMREILATRAKQTWGGYILPASFLLYDISASCHLFLAPKYTAVPYPHHVRVLLHHRDLLERTLSLQVKMYQCGGSVIFRWESSVALWAQSSSTWSCSLRS